MANGYREVEELEVTRVEKALVIGLVVFLLIGGLWMFERMDRLILRPVLSAGEYSVAGVTLTEPPIEDELGVPPADLLHVLRARRRLWPDWKLHQRKRENWYDLT